MRWVHTSLPAAQVEALSKQAGVSLVVAELLVRAGRAESAGSFLRPVLAGLADPFLLPNVAAAADRLRAAIAARERIIVLATTMSMA